MIEAYPWASKTLDRGWLFDAAFEVREEKEAFEFLESLKEELEAEDEELGGFGSLKLQLGNYLNEVRKNPVLPVSVLAAFRRYKEWEKVLKGVDDVRYLSHGVFDAYTGLNLRASQNAPLSMLEEINTGNNLPAQVEIFSTTGSEYQFYIMAKGGGSSNKTALYQENKSLLADEHTLYEFLKEKIKAIGVAACPPYRMAVVVGGLSPEMNIKTVKLASAGFLDDLTTTPTGKPHGFRRPGLGKESSQDCQRDWLRSPVWRSSSGG